MKLKERVPASIIGLILILLTIGPFSAKAQYEDVSLETFYEELSPYGVWIEDPQYGRVWRPDVDQDEFRPYYTNGHWEMTKYGNTWVSDYDWGWAPFHYGRWHHSSRRGWVWVPDIHWGPAWVSWRSGGGYYGWAPLGPGINININIGRIPDLWWVFVPQRHIYYDRYPRYDYRRNRTIYHNTVIINNTYVYNRNKYYTGPQAREIQKVTRQPVKIHDVRNNRPTYAGRSSRPESVNRPANVTQSPRPDRSAVNSGSARSNDSGGRTSDRSTGNAGRSASTTDQRVARSTSATRNEASTSKAEVDRGSRAGSDRESGRYTPRATSPAGSQANPGAERSRTTRIPQRTERQQTQRESSNGNSATRIERSQQSRPSQSSGRSSGSTQRTEVRQAPSGNRQSAGRSSNAPSARSAERSSSSGRPSRGN